MPAKKDGITISPRFSRWGEMARTKVEVTVVNSDEPLVGIVERAPLIDNKQWIVLKTPAGPEIINAEHVVKVKPLEKPRYDIDSTDLKEPEQDVKNLPCKGTQRVAQKPCKFPLQQLYDLCKKCPNRMSVSAKKDKDRVGQEV